MTTTVKTIESQCQLAKQSCRELALLTTEQKNNALEAMAKALLNHSEAILDANKQDLEAGKQNGISQALLDRLGLTQERIEDISEGILVIKNCEDPVGEVMDSWSRPNGLKISKVRVPLGVIGMIYEARPNVTADAIALAIKTNNSIVLRGSSSAYASNKAISDCMRQAASKHGVPEASIQLLEDCSHEGVKTFVRLNESLDLVIPRGGAALIQNVVQTATVPTIETGVGNCHVYVDKEADTQKAIDIVINAKTHRPSVCNACETLLVHQDIAETLLPTLLETLNASGVEIRGDQATQNLFSKSKPATDDDWETEYLDMILAVKIVSSFDEALEHIHNYGSHHSEAIVTQNTQKADEFCQKVHASATLVNTSTRFVDGGEFGFGAEIGISTQMLHARGPMGLREITSYKYIIKGDGQVRS